MKASRTAFRKYVVLPYEPDKESAPPAVRTHQIDRQAQLRRYEVDRRSVYMGNLPHDTDETELRNMGERFCAVMGIEVHRNGYGDGSSEFAPFNPSRSAFEAYRFFSPDRLRVYRVRPP